MKFSFPWIAFGLGLVLSLVLLGDMQGAGNVRKLPLLAALLMAEFGLLATAIAAVLGVRDLVTRGIRQPVVVLLVAGNLLLAAWFLRTGIALWPGPAGAVS
ncbi:MAG: hypothetical protein J5I92_06075 [Thiogranum sp.]|nr:hypothetical protein [Thiogranum sp.]